MDDPKLTREQQSGTSKIKEQLFAGKAALEKEELESLLILFEDKLNEIYVENLFNKYISTIQTWLLFAG